MHSSGFEFNKEKLFLHFNGLVIEYFEKLKKQNSSSFEKNYMFFQLYHDEFIFRAYYAYSILKRMRLLKEKALKPQFEGLKQQLNITNEKEILFSSFITREYIYFIMPFLNTLFILQDRIMILIGEFLGIKEKYNKLPKYYYDYKNKNDKVLPLYPKPIQTLLINYWEKHGNQIRQYRNLDQHQYQLYYHSFYRLKPTEEFVLYLPDKISKDIQLHEITYNKKIIALDFFEREFNAFHDFVEKMIKQINVPPLNIKPGQSFEPLEGLAKYQNGELLSTMILGNEAILFRVSDDNLPDSEAKGLRVQKIQNKIQSFRWEFK